MSALLKPCSSLNLSAHVRRPRLLQFWRAVEQSGQTHAAGSIPWQRRYLQLEHALALATYFNEAAASGHAISWWWVEGLRLDEQLRLELRPMKRATGAFRRNIVRNNWPILRDVIGIILNSEYYDVWPDSLEPSTRIDLSPAEWCALLSSALDKLRNRIETAGCPPSLSERLWESVAEDVSLYRRRRFTLLLQVAGDRARSARGVAIGKSLFAGFGKQLLPRAILAGLGCLLLCWGAIWLLERQNRPAKVAMPDQQASSPSFVPSDSTSNALAGEANASEAGSSLSVVSGDVPVLQTTATLASSSSDIVLPPKPDPTEPAFQRRSGSIPLPGTNGSGSTLIISNNVQPFTSNAISVVPLPVLLSTNSLLASANTKSVTPIESPTSPPLTARWSVMAKKAELIVSRGGRSAAMKFFLIEGASYIRGDNSRIAPNVRATVSPFYLGEQEITEAEWDLAFSGSSGATPYTKLSTPKTGASWAAAQHYCKIMTAALSAEHPVVVRLPMEVEWEYVAQLEYRRDRDTRMFKALLDGLTEWMQDLYRENAYNFFKNNQSCPESRDQNLEIEHVLRGDPQDLASEAVVFRRWKANDHGSHTGRGFRLVVIPK